MLIAAPFTNDSRWRDIPDEYNITYTETSTAQKLVDFCETIPNKQINVYFKNIDIDYTSLELALRINPNIVVVLDTLHREQSQILKNNNIKFFFHARSMPCYSLDLLDALIELQVSEIYLFGQLLYNLPEVKQRCEGVGIRTRLILNTIETFNPKRGEDFRSPIFSPRDKQLLDKYVDIAEFDCYIYPDMKNYNWNRFNVLRHAWFDNEDWMGDLKEINHDLKFSIPNYSIFPNFSERRIQCGRRCSLGSPCRHCELLINSAKNLDEQNIYIKGEKE